MLKPAVAPLPLVFRKPGLTVTQRNTLHSDTLPPFLTFMAILLSTRSLLPNNNQYWAGLAVYRHYIFHPVYSHPQVGRRKVLQSLIYNGSEISDYASYSRNRALDLASMWQGKDIESRMFNRTTIGKEIKAYIQLCLAICNQAKRADRAETLECAEPQSREARMVQWRNDMGLNRKEFLSVRQYLIDNINENERNRRTA